MGYRGEDLDLRTPQTWSATPTDLAGTGDAKSQLNGPRGAYRSGPIWVDDTVLACSNHAFDVALAHRAGEVRLEHLLHALTRIDAAAEALEARGVRVAALRRESATIIASEIPVGLPNGKGAPRRSEEFAEVLRLAAVNAVRRNAPAGIEDLLYVLFDQRSDLPGLSLLSRHTVRATRETIEPLPPIPRYVAEPRYTAPERTARVPVEPVRYAPEPARSYRSEFDGTATDTVQNSRIEALEQMVRALSNDLASERQVVSNLLKDLSQETRSQRDDHGLLTTGLQDRLQNLEQAVRQTRDGDVSANDVSELVQAVHGVIEQRFGDMSRSWSALTDRLQNLELAVREKPTSSGIPGDLVERISRAIDLKPIANRLDVIEEALLSSDNRNESDIADRLKSLEGEIARALSANSASTTRMEALVAGFDRQKTDLAGALAGPVIERVTALVGNATGQQAAMTDGISKVIDRLNGVERAVAAEIETAAAKHQAYAQDLTEVHDALMKLNQNQHTLAGSIDQWRTDATGDLSVISNRLTSLDRDNERPIETLNAMQVHMDTMNKLMIERYHRRNRFWYWLFGTDDWIGASWPSQAAAMESERQRLKLPQTA
jgi:predicted  nucleic acid-binding Zn-ribbon protein